jgi:hypothetical protein
MKTITTLVLSLCLVAGPAHAAVITVFETNDNGNAAALDGSAAGDTVVLTQSNSDPIGMTFVRVQADIQGNSKNQTIGMTAGTMGISNEKWGDPSQGMEFSFDKDLDFIGMEFSLNAGTGLSLFSAAWKDDATGQSGGAGANAWTFTSDGSVGSFKFFGTGVYDFSAGTFSTVPAGESITVHRSSGGSSGVGMNSFTVNVVPEPSSFVLSGLGGVALCLLRRQTCFTVCHGAQVRRRQRRVLLTTQP